MLGDTEIEIAEAETVTDTAAAVRRMTTAVESDTTRVMDMMIRAANEGISLSKSASFCWVGSFDFSPYFLSPSG